MKGKCIRPFVFPSLQVGLDYIGQYLTKWVWKLINTMKGRGERGLWWTSSLTLVQQIGWPRSIETKKGEMRWTEPWIQKPKFVLSVTLMKTPFIVEIVSLLKLLSVDCGYFGDPNTHTHTHFSVTSAVKFNFTDVTRGHWGSEETLSSTLDNRLDISFDHTQPIWPTCNSYNSSNIWFPGSFIKSSPQCPLAPWTPAHNFTSFPLFRLSHAPTTTFSDRSGKSNKMPTQILFAFCIRLTKINSQAGKQEPKDEQKNAGGGGKSRV